MGYPNYTTDPAGLSTAEARTSGIAPVPDFFYR